MRNEADFSEELREGISGRDKKIVDALNHVTHASPLNAVNVNIPKILEDLCDGEIIDSTDIEGRQSFKKRKRSPEITEI